MRGICRRLERLEARVGRVDQLFSITIDFIDSEKRVTSSLRLGPGSHEWIKRESEPGAAPDSADTDADSAASLNR